MTTCCSSNSEEDRERGLAILESLRSQIRGIPKSGLPTIPPHEILKQLPPDWLKLISLHVHKQVTDRLREERKHDDLQLYFTLILLAIEFIGTNWCGVNMSGLTCREIQIPVKSEQDLVSRLIGAVASVYMKALVPERQLPPFNPVRDCPSAWRHPTFTE